MPEKTIYLRSKGRAICKIQEISGQDVYQCMQCGTCSAVCPMSESMTFTPRKTMLYLQFDQLEEITDSKMEWYCAACHTCLVRCPREIDIPKILEAVRLLALRNNEDFVDLANIPKETLEDAPQIVFVSGFRKLTA